MQIAILTARHQVPAIYPTRDYAEAGGLISYGADLIDAREVALTSGQAAARLGQLLDSGSKRLDATKFALGVAGIKPVDDARLSVSIELRAGYVIDLSESGRPEQKIVGGQVIDAKPIDG